MDSAVSTGPAGSVRALAAGAVAALVVLSGVSIAVSPPIGLAAAAAAFAGLIFVLRPEYAAAGVAFLLWANVPVVAMRSHGVPKFVASAYILLLLLPILRSLFFDRQRLQLHRSFPWAGMYLAFSILSAAFARDPGRAMEGANELLLEGIVVFVLVALAIRDRESLKRVTWGLLAAGAFMGAIALLQQVSGRFESDFGGFASVDSGFSTGGAGGQGSGSQPRLAGPIGEKNRFGQFMLVIVALGVGLARGEKNAAARRLAYGAAALSAIGAALTFSRGNAVAFALLVGVMGALGTVSRRQVVGLALAGFLMLLALPQYRERLATIPAVLLLANSSPDAKAPDGAILGRATEVIAAALVYIDHPVLGVGPGLFASYSQEYGNKLSLRRLDSEREAHMLIPHVAAEGGTLGLTAFCGLLMVVMVALYRRSKDSSDPETQRLAGAYLLALCAYLLCGLFLHMAFIRYFWFLVAAASAAAWVPAGTEGRSSASAGTGLLKGREA